MEMLNGLEETINYLRTMIQLGIQICGELDYMHVLEGVTNQTQVHDWFV